jgi:hypothetical protein
MSNSRLLLALITLCSACGGSSFEAGGAGAGGTSAQAGGSSQGGDTSAAGAPSGGSGADSSAGASGQSTGGAAAAGAGGSSTGGDSAGGASAGAGTGGSHAGAGGSSAGAGGSAGVANCATLKTEYAAALEKARVCDMGSMNQCDKSSTLPNIGCGCPALVNAKSEATTLAKQKYQAFQDAKCPIGPICNIACLAYTSATCSAAATGGGFVCTGSNAGIAN